MTSVTIACAARRPGPACKPACTASRRASSWGRSPPAGSTSWSSSWSDARGRAMDLDFHDLLLTPSDVLEHLFCGRFTYFERHLLLPEFQERREKVRRGGGAAA